MKRVLMSAKNKKGWKLEALLEVLQTELNEKSENIRGDDCPLTSMILHNNAAIVELLGAATEIQKQTMRELDRLGDDQGPGGVPRIPRKVEYSTPTKTILGNEEPYVVDSEIDELLKRTLKLSGDRISDIEDFCARNEIPELVAGRALSCNRSVITALEQTIGFEENFQRFIGIEMAKK